MPKSPSLVRRFVSPPRRILEAVRRNPGIGVRELQRETGLALGTVQKHVKELRRAKALRAAGRGTKLALTLPGVKLPAASVPTSLLELLALLEANGPMRQVEIIELSGNPRSTVQHRLRTLAKLGLLREHRGAVYPGPSKD